MLSQTLKSFFYSNDEMEDKLHDVQVSFESIYAWKRHLLRAVHQDRARQDVLDAVDSSKIFITQDFAMKFLPRRFKETQMEWFGKRGISWHISHCVRRRCSNECEVSVYSHLFRQSISQNSVTKLLLQLCITPSVKKRQDTQR